MKRKLYWGLGVLAVLLLGVSLGFLIRPTHKEPIKIYRGDTEPSKAVIDSMRHKVSKNKSSTARVPKTKSGGLTYHAELLETNPVKALRLQAEERGHWSREHIPPFPPDDTEAQAFAKSIYLMTYYQSLGYGYENIKPDNFDPESSRIHANATRAYISQIRAFDKYEGARSRDLWRLSWTRTNAGEITPYGGFVPGVGRARMFRSDYFPDFIDVPADNILDRIRELEKMQRAE